MSWTDIFSVLDDAMLDAYREGVTEDVGGDGSGGFSVVGGVLARGRESLLVTSLGSLESDDRVSFFLH